MALASPLSDFSTDLDSLLNSPGINWGTPPPEDSRPASPDTYLCGDFHDVDAHRNDSPPAELACEMRASSTNKGMQMPPAKGPITDTRGVTLGQFPEAQPLLRPTPPNNIGLEAEERDERSDKRLCPGKGLGTPRSCVPYELAPGMPSTTNVFLLARDVLDALTTGDTLASGQAADDSTHGRSASLAEYSILTNSDPASPAEGVIGDSSDNGALANPTDAGAALERLQHIDEEISALIAHKKKLLSERTDIKKALGINDCGK